MNEELEDEEFISFETKEGSHILISHFGKNEYKCTGRCFCEDEFGERRRTGTIGKSSKGLLYFVAALSSFLAAQFAEEHFKKVCEDEALLNNNCGHIVHSEIGDCEDLNPPVFGNPLGLETDEPYEDISDNIFGGMRQEVEVVKYLCKGHCYPNTQEFSPLTLESKKVFEGNVRNYVGSSWPKPVDLEKFREKSESFGCEKLEMEETFQSHDVTVAKLSLFSALTSYCPQNSVLDECLLHGCYCDDEKEGISNPTEDVENTNYFSENIFGKCDGKPGGEICKSLNCKYYKDDKIESFPLCTGIWDTDFGKNLDEEEEFMEFPDDEFPPGSPDGVLPGMGIPGTGYQPPRDQKIMNPSIVCRLIE